jgi:AbrB family looped-hinge helix DNA binding protein
VLKIYRVLGKKGRITIPYEIRQQIGFRYNDVLSFNQQDDGSVLVRREKICDNCKELAEEYEENFTLEDFLDSLSEHFYIFLCCGQKSRNTKSEVNL